MINYHKILCKSKKQQRGWYKNAWLYYTQVSLRQTMLLCVLTKDKLMLDWWLNGAWQTPFNVCGLSQTTRIQVRYEATWYTVGRKEHSGPAAQDVNCFSLSLAAGEESSGGYSSWQISKGRQRLFVQYAEPPGEPRGVTGFCLGAQTGAL